MSYTESSALLFRHRINGLIRIPSTQQIPLSYEIGHFHGRAKEEASLNSGPQSQTLPQRHMSSYSPGSISSDAWFVYAKMTVIKHGGTVAASVRTG